MTSKEMLHWFWATGALPGTTFDDLGDQKDKPSAWIRPHLRCMQSYLKQQLERHHSSERKYSVKEVS